MRSGNGRHRRPRQAPAIFVAAGVTGAGLAMPLLAAGGAQAADGSAWDRVAQCESEGVWSANEENGYYGGLQITLNTWEQYGGNEFAERPDLASRSEQITVAERVLAAQGAQAWPGCATDGGLTEGGAETSAPERPGDPEQGEPDDPSAPGDTTVDRGDAERGERTTPRDPDPSADERDRGYPGDPDPGAPDPSESPESSETPDSPAYPAFPASPERGGEADMPDPGPSPSPSTPGEDSTTDPGDDPTGDPEGERPSEEDAGRTIPSVPVPEEGSGKHRGQPDDRERGGERAERGGDSGRDGERVQGSGKHRVTSGESLTAIAEERGVTGGWHELYERNKETVGEDPDLILPGQSLRL
ncbi:hypothetical protein E0L36_00315 [Streptomyces sp. AJS327]|uniref:transglycosylase family protein n=1 Tax=Streptomyces sp. AJS327 TaxID=2545265 RepID=UPI0015DF2584|nr:transglycosylase family protein [Streptomyces sp. AJS327]MBA0049412.1 hypothetical protein [Streptomyces sp. AJS327]